jgi:hypothetical protein
MQYRHDLLRRAINIFLISSVCTSRLHDLVVDLVLPSPTARVVISCVSVPVGRLQSRQVTQNAFSATIAVTSAFLSLAR